ncbi:MAG: hypothetical protein ABIJ09_09420 [Pseudomonadota bacterium]
MSAALRRRLALGCHGLVVLGLALAGLRYGLATQPMPYHLELLGRRWPEIPLPTQTLLLALLHGAGAAMFAGSLALGVLLAIPWRRGERWAGHAVPVLAAAGLAPLLVITAQLREMGARTPWWLVALAMALSLAGWALGPGARDLPGPEVPAKMADHDPGDGQR